MTPQEQNIAQPAPPKHRMIPYIYAEDGTKLKVCTDCLVPQSFDNFPKGKKCRDGIYPTCKLCCQKYNEQYHLKNKKKHNEYSKEWGNQNKQRIAERNKKVLDEYLQAVELGIPEKTKICTKCKGEPKPLTSFPINLGHSDGFSSQCKTCMNKQVLDWYYRNKESISQVGKDQRKSTWARRAIKSCKQRASRKSLPFDIEVTDLYDQRTGQLPTNCPLFPHIVLDFEAGPDRRLWASVDRIFPELGYVKGNICVISYGANTWKSNGSNPVEREIMTKIMNGSLFAI